MEFLRRFKRSHISIGGKLSPEAFECDTEDLLDGLSLTKAEGELLTPLGLTRYWHVNTIGKSKDRLGIAKIKIGSLVNKGTVTGLRIQPVDGPFGESHFVIDCPDRPLADVLAKNAVVALPPMKGEFAENLQVRG